MTELTEDVQAFIEEPYLAHFVTLMKNGSPQVTPVWVDHDGTHVVINTVEGHQKAINLRREPRVALSIVAKDNPGHVLQVRGRVVAIIGGAEAIQHINKMQKKYSGDPNREYPLRPGEERLLIRIRPDHVTYRASFGGGGGRRR